MTNYRTFTAGKYKIRQRGDKFYIYLIEKVDDKLKETYIAPLDKVVEYYLQGQKAEQKSAPSESDVVQFNNKVNEFAPANEEVTLGKLDEFFEWCTKKRGNSADTCKDYISYLKKPLNKENKWSVIAYRLYYQFLGLNEKAKELKVKKTVSVPVYKVPSIDQIRSVLSYPDERVVQLYRLLLESGLRLKEALYMLNNYDPTLDQKEDGFYIYTVNMVRKSKKSFYAFHITPLKRITISESLTRHLELPVRPKMVRKFVATKMLELGIPAEIVDFLQGRTPSSILAKHYLDLLTLAKKEYKKYINWLSQELLI